MPFLERSRRRLIFSASSGDEPITLGSVGWADAALKPREDRSDGNAAIKSYTSEGTRDENWVDARVSLEVQRDEKLGLRRSCLFVRRRRPSIIGCARGLQRSCCSCSGGPTSCNGGFSPLKQPKTPHKFACHASVTWDMPRPGGQTPPTLFDSIDSIRFSPKNVFSRLFVKFV